MQVRYSSSTPFIGKLSLKFLELTNTKHGMACAAHHSAEAAFHSAWPSNTQNHSAAVTCTAT